MSDRATAAVQGIAQLPIEMHKHIIKAEPTGSRAICTPAPTDTDEDWLILVDDWAKFSDVAIANEWGVTGPGDSEKYPEFFASLRKGEMNLIATESESFFDKFSAATFAAKRLNLLNKSDRIALFQAVLYCNKYEETP